MVNCICKSGFRNTHGIMADLEKMAQRLFLSVSHVGSPTPPLSRTVCMSLFLSVCRCHYVVWALYFYFLSSTKALSSAPLSRSGWSPTLLFEKSGIICKLHAGLCLIITTECKYTESPSPLQDVVYGW